MRSVSRKDIIYKVIIGFHRGTDPLPKPHLQNGASMKKANITDVAKLAGVSIATVSNVCTGNKYVSKELRQKVLDAIVKLNYKPNYLASNLRNRNTKMIAVMIPSHSMEYFGEILQGILDCATAMGFVIMTFETKSRIEREVEYLEIANELMVSGVIILSQAMDCDAETKRRYTSLLSALTEQQEKAVPVISIMRETGIGTVDEILLDNLNSSADAVRHLIELGHTHIGTITGGIDSEIARDRQRGYELALREANLPADPDYIVNCPDYSVKNGFNAMKHLLENTPVTAVFAGNDSLAIGAMKCAQSMGLRIPEDLSVIGFDGLSVGELVSPTLSTVNVSSYDLGYMSMERLGRRLSNDDLPYAPAVIHPPVVRRQSTGPAPVK